MGREKRMLTGIYWWIPVPQANGSSEFDWEVQPFYGIDVFHDDLWERLLDILNEHWNKHITRQDAEYAGLPRGRVNYPHQEQMPVLYHGNDSPGELDAAKKAFNLPDQAKTLYDDHERMISLDHQQMVSALGINLGLAVPDELADDELDDAWG